MLVQGFVGLRLVISPKTEKGEVSYKIDVVIDVMMSHFHYSGIFFFKSHLEFKKPGLDYSLKLFN